MYVVCVNVFVKTGHEGEFIEATEFNHRGTLQEPGALRFDVLRSASEPGHFVLYEVYRDEAGFKAHQQTEHYHTWRDTVADWMEKPRQAFKCHSVFPGDQEAAWSSNS